VSEPAARRAELVRVAAWAVLLFSGLFLLTTGGTYPGIASVEGHIVGQVIAYAVLVGWLLLALRKPEWRPTTPLFWPILIAAAAYGLAAVFSQRPRLGLEPTIAGIGWAVGFMFLTVLLTRPWFRARVGVLLTAFVVVVAFGYLVQVAIEWIKWWQVIGRLAVPPLRPSFAALFLGSPNLIATALILAAPLAIAMAWTRGERGRLLAWALAIAAALAVFVSGSRAAFLGVELGALIAAGLFAHNRGGGRATVAWIVDRFRAQPILLVPFIAVCVFGGAFAPAVLNRFASGGFDLRFDLWRSAVNIFLAHPILGAGPGTWVQLKVAANPDGVPNVILPHAHNMYFQAAAEVGIVGMLTLAVLALAVLWRLWQGWRSTDRSISIEAGAVIVSLVTLASQSFFDNFSNLPFVVLLVAILVAWVDGGIRRVEPPDARAARRSGPGWMTSIQASPLLVGVLLAALLLPAPFLVQADRAALQAQEGDDRAHLGQTDTALLHYADAMELDPDFTLYALQAASAYSRLNHLSEARAILLDAVKADPVAVNLIGLAALESRMGMDAEAMEHARQAIELGYGEPIVALNAGLIAEHSDAELAIDQFANAIAWDPPLASSDFWDDSERAISKADVIDAATNKVGPLDAELIRAYAGDAAAARAALEAMEPIYGAAIQTAYLAAVIGIGGDTATSLSMFQGLLDANVNDWFAAALASRVAHRGGADAESARYAMWAITVQGDGAPGLIADASVVPASDTDTASGLPANYPWSTYLRPVSPSVLMPDLTVIGLR
jgi:tetratricopeptide (TPR) repeat protein